MALEIAEVGVTKAASVAVDPGLMIPEVAPVELGQLTVTERACVSSGMTMEKIKTSTKQEGNMDAIRCAMKGEKCLMSAMSE